MSVRDLLNRVLCLALGIALLATAVHSVRSGTFRVPLVRHLIRVVIHREQEPVAFYALVGAMVAAGLWMLYLTVRGGGDDDA